MGLDPDRVAAGADIERPRKVAVAYSGLNGAERPRLAVPLALELSIRVATEPGRKREAGAIANLQPHDRPRPLPRPHPPRPLPRCRFRSRPRYRRR